VKALSKVMTDTGALLALQIDAYAQERVSTYPSKMLHRIIREGQSHTGRILHYFPFENKGEAEDDWCGWHNDHGSLTALTSALYTDEHGQEIKFPLKTGGLYAKNRFADVAKIGIPTDMLAFQLGESTQIHTGGYLEATPHCVVRSEELAGKKVGRNTFALFLEPDPLEVMGVPKGVNPENVTEKTAYKIPPIKQRWENGIFFKDFHSRTIKYYS
jgi:isopenicillin N synthase-like dioxygenase